MNVLSDLIGLGLYSVPEAARLAEVAPARVRGWVQGDGTGTPRRAAVVGHALPDVDGKTALSFRERNTRMPGHRRNRVADGPFARGGGLRWRMALR